MKVRSFIILITMVILFLAGPANAYELEDVQWISSVDSTLHWGGTLKDGIYTDDIYTIEAADFDEDGFVYINLFKNSVLIDHSPMQVGNSLEYRDISEGKDLRIYVSEVDLDINEWTGEMRDPTASIQVFERGVPAFGITIETDDDTYDPRTAASVDGIEVTVSVENTGDADADDLILTISGAELKDGDLVHEISSLAIDEVSETFIVKLEIPYFWEKTDIDIKATVEGYDINNDVHSDEASERVTIEPKAELLITKSSVSEAYMGDNVRITVSVRNWGICSISGVHIEDYLHNDFEILDNVVLKEDLSLSPEESVILFEYSLKPLNDGDHTLPATKATFSVDGESYTAESQQPEIQVDGPIIEVSQSLSDSDILISESSTVNVVVSNTGNRDSSVYVSSEPPEGLSFVSGDLFVDQVLDDGTSVTYSYVVEATENGTFTIPAAEGSFIDMASYKGEKISNSLSLLVGEQVESEDPASSSSSSSSSEDTESSSNGNPIFTIGDPVESEDVEDESLDDNKVEPGFSSLLGVFVIGLLYIFKRHR